jgi:hypothetical protein
MDLHARNPVARTESRRQAAPGTSSAAIGPNEIRARTFKIRSAWTEAERRRRAYTARMVQWLLVGPPVGFRLQAE